MRDRVHGSVKLKRDSAILHRERARSADVTFKGPKLRRDSVSLHKASARSAPTLTIV